MEYTSARSATREAPAVARGSSSLIVRLLFWLLFLVAAAVVAFFVGPPRVQRGDQATVVADRRSAGRARQEESTC